MQETDEEREINAGDVLGEEDQCMRRMGRGRSIVGDE